MDNKGYEIFDFTDLNRPFKNGLLWLVEILFVKKDMTDKDFQYYYGIYNNFKDVEFIWKKFNDLQLGTLIIRVFIDGTEIPRKKIIDYVIDNPDLVLYMNYSNQLK